MFCPECGAEYVEGIRKCADCGVALVVKLTRPEEKKPIEYERLLSTFNQGDIAVIKSLLGDARVDFYFTGEMFNAVDPLIQPAILHVKKGHGTRAKEVLSGMRLSFMGVGGRKR